MIILDTNVISEIIKKQPDEHVANWLRNQDTSNLATTAITVAELLAGICRMPEGKRRKYTDTTVKLALMTLEDRTFAFDTQAAADYAHILVEREHRGHTCQYSRRHDCGNCLFLGCGHSHAQYQGLRRYRRGID